MAVTRVNGGALPVVTTGRALTHYTVSLTNVHVSSGAVNSDFEKLVRAIETVATVELLGTPAAGAFRVAVSGPSLAATGAGSMELICNTAVATTTVAALAY